MWLTAALRSDPPPALALRVRREHARPEHSRWWPVQVAAAAMAALLIANGAGSLVNGAWVAENLGEQHSPHAFAERGLALIPVGIPVAPGVLPPRRPPAADLRREGRRVGQGGFVACQLTWTR